MQTDPNNVFELSLFLQNAFHFIENCEMDLSIDAKHRILRPYRDSIFINKIKKGNRKRRQSTPMHQSHSFELNKKKCNFPWKPMLYIR